MKFIFFASLFLFVHTLAPAQVVNTRTGNWSDPTLWSRNLVPSGADSVTLEFDVVIDETAACKFLQLNGHNVTVKTGIDFAVGKPVLARDTATLLTVTTTTLFNGEINDSVHRVLKNSYVNGLRRLVAMETSGTPDTGYTVFGYNNQNQLVSLLQYNYYGDLNVYRTSISWTNNRVTKLATSGGEEPPSVYFFSYMANGANTDVVITHADTTFNQDKSIVFTRAQKTVLTVSPSFKPISKHFYEYQFFEEDQHANFDTSTTTYQYDADGNLAGMSEHEYINSSYPGETPFRSTDTTIRTFVRNNPDSASVYRLLVDVYGNELLALMDYNFFPIEIRDVTGYAYPPYGFGEYRQQTVSSMIVSRKQYLNSKLVEESPPQQQYRAVNEFDNRHRLTSSIIDDGGNYPLIITMRLEYPD